MTTLSQTAVTMTSLQIAELVEKRHDNVKRTIETLANQSVIRKPQIEETEEINNLGLLRRVKHYRFTGEQGRRDSIVVVAQLSPEFTARLVDRWRELEQQAALAAFNIPQTYPDALRLAADLTDKVAVLEHTISEQAPKAEVYDRIAEASDTYLVRAAAKVLGVGPRQLVAWLLNHGWAYRHSDKGHLLAKQDKLNKGWLAHKLTPFWNRRTQMNDIAAALRVTTSGMTELAKQVPAMAAA